MTFKLWLSKVILKYLKTLKLGKLGKPTGFSSSTSVHIKHRGSVIGASSQLSKATGKANAISHFGIIALLASVETSRI